MMRITPFSLAAALLSFSALVPFSALAGQSYTPPKAEFELVKAPPALNKFLEKARDTAQAESGPDQPKHLAALFADDVQIITGLEAGDFKLQKLDAAKPKLDQLGKYLKTMEPDAKLSATEKAADSVWRYIAASLDGPWSFGTYPGHAGEICMGPVVKLDTSALAAALAAAPDASVMVTKKPTAVHAGWEGSSAKDKRVIETIPAKLGIIYLENVGNGGEFNGKVRTPDGKEGYVNDADLISVRAPDFCFKQVNGAWLISLVSKQTP